MKVLLAAKHPPGGRLKIGGVQTWTRTVQGELLRRGHRVAVWGPQWHQPSMLFDLGIFANWNCTAPAAARCQRTIRISHGIIADEMGDPTGWATSEDVQQKWNCKGVIRQPLDLAYWTPADYPRDYLTRHSYRAGLPYLQNIAAQRGLKFLHLRNREPAQVRAILRRSQVVIATGRAAVEAMACGAPVVICDARPYQGELLDPDVCGSMCRNYSGRGGVTPDQRMIDLEIDQAIRRGNLRAHVVQHHDVKKIVDRILEIDAPGHVA